MPVLPIPSWAGTWVPAAGAVGAEAEEAEAEEAEAEEAEAEEAGAVGVFEWEEGFQETPSFPDICPMEAISMLDGKAGINEEECSGCGLCVDECPSGAIRLES